MTKKSAGNTPQNIALMLSGGGALGNFHLGVARTLYQNNALPAIISGASAGALVAAMICTRSSEELDTLLTDDIGAMAWLDPQKYEFYSAMVAADAMQAFVDQVVPDLTFAECYEISGKSLAISVSAPKREDGGLLLSHVETPDILVRDAVLASCAVPLVFAPKRLRCRKNGETTPFRGRHHWIDGSIYADLPKADLTNQFGANTFIASMVNPVAAPFIGNTSGFSHASPIDPLGLTSFATETSAATLSTMAHGIANIMGVGMAMVKPLSQAVPRMATYPFLHINDMTNIGDFWNRIAGQSYSADVTIIPRQGCLEPHSMMQLMTEDQRRFVISEGESATRQKMLEIQELVA